ncbi:MAG: hypothetical protein RIS35_1190 [Pseudomonadota bacterium]|jgi:hypothetical protein
MPRKSADLAARDAARDLNAELLEATRQLRAGAVGRVTVLPADGPRSSPR